MFCPDCGAEYRPRFAECAECGVRLVSALPAEQRPDPDPGTVPVFRSGERPDPDSKIVPVFRTSDAMLLPIVKSLLESADIDYFVQGEEALGLLPVGAMGSGVSLGRATLGAIVHVFDRDAAVVRELLTEIGETEDMGAAEEG